jgi:hypothetical protein
MAWNLERVNNGLAMASRIEPVTRMFQAMPGSGRMFARMMPVIKARENHRRGMKV